jgi:hypothetical protein
VCRWHASRCRPGVMIPASSGVVLRGLRFALCWCLWALDRPGWKISPARGRLLWPLLTLNWIFATRLVLNQTRQLPRRKVMPCLCYACANQDLTRGRDRKEDMETPYASVKYATQGCTIWYWYPESALVLSESFQAPGSRFLLLHVLILSSKGCLLGWWENRHLCRANRGYDTKC